MAGDTRVIYQALSALAQRYGAHSPMGGAARRGSLTPFELRVFSQNGEDGVIEEILARIGTGTESFVEFGVERGTEGNCVFLADVLGWRGLFMEADPLHHEFLAGKYRYHGRISTALTRVGPENINALLTDFEVPAELDVLSIDVDGIDLWIWNAIAVVRPRVVVIEYNSHLDPSSAVTQPLDPVVNWDGTDYFGASLGALRRVGRRRGYRLVHTDVAGVNAFFFHEGLAGPFPHEDDVVARAPNYFFSGAGHPPHAGGRRYVEPSV